MKLLLAAVVLLLATSAGAHPGRLDKNGCHKVTKTVRIESGVRYKAGTSHCHRPLGEWRFGQDVLEAPQDAEAKAPRKETKK